MGMSVCGLWPENQKKLFCVKLRAMFLFLSVFTAVQKRGIMGEVERNATECIGFYSSSELCACKNRK